MGERFRFWWRQITKSLDAVIIILLVVMIVLFAIIILGYIFHWDWTGLTGFNGISIATDVATTPHKITRTIIYQPGKTLWDWLQLLIIPAVLAVVGYVINLTISRSEQKATKQRYQTEHEIAEDNQREVALQDYIDKMSELLLDKDHPLRDSQPDDEVRKIARVRTLTILARLDKERKSTVLQFLHESGLIDKGMKIIDLSDANLTDAKLSFVILSGADLSGANLSRAGMFMTLLNNANLSKASFNFADLNGANLSGADLSDTVLNDIKLWATDLSDANLSGAIGITIEQLERQTSSLQGTTMPDGSIHS